MVLMKKVKTTMLSKNYSHCHIEKSKVSSFVLMSTHDAWKEILYLQTTVVDCHKKLSDGA